MIQDLYIKGVAAASGSSVGAKILKTGLTTSYRTGDDGDLEIGREVDFFTLGSNNPFGNTARFTDTVGTAVYTDTVLIDWSTYDGATVLGWRITDNGVDLNWDDAIDGAAALSISTWTTGWRLPNNTELTSIGYCNSSAYLNYGPWLQGNNRRWWTSTTDAGSTTTALVRPNRRWEYGAAGKTSSANLRYYPCRTFTVTGTVLT